ncbi:MAG: Ig-like domain-containing protein [Eubacterium sp.]|nr:Ig-like domain-containing protein [Eubacterium sp.]
MTRKSIYSIISIILLTILFLFTPLTRMTVSADAAALSLPPMIVLTKYSKTMAIGEEFGLIAVASNGKQPTFKSSKSSIASVNTYGLVTAKKAGTCKITAKIKNAEASCLITVKQTTLSIQPSGATLYRQGTKQLTATVSTGHSPTWKSSKSSVATVDENGLVTAVKHGTAKITATADGVSKSCTITVKQPKIKLSASSLSMDAGSKHRLSAFVSSGNKPEWSTSNQNVLSVDQNGNVTARKKGRAYVYAREDGVKASCVITVNELKEAD